MRDFKVGDKFEVISKSGLLHYYDIGDIIVS